MRTNRPAATLPRMPRKPGKVDILKASFPIRHNGRLIGFGTDLEFIPQVGKSLTEKGADSGEDLNAVFDSSAIFPVDKPPVQISREQLTKHATNDQDENSCLNNLFPWQTRG